MTWNSSKLIYDYIKNGNLKVAESLWNSGALQYKSRNIKTYGLMMNAYIKYGQCHKCLELFEELNQRQIELNDIIYLILLKACNKSNNFEATKLLHSHLMHQPKQTIYHNIKIQNSLIGLYSKFDTSTAFELYHNLINLNLKPNMVTYLAMIKLISVTKDINTAIQMHENIKLIPDYAQDIKIQNGLISMYSSCSDFDTAIAMFNAMKHDQSNKCDEITYLNMIKCCSKSKRLNEGKSIHKEIDQPYLINNIKLQNSLINMYHNCADYASAMHVFNKMKRKDITTYSMAFKLCAYTKDLDAGKKIHQTLEQETNIRDMNIQNGVHKHTWLYNELMNMYAKCGDIEQTEHIWNVMKEKCLIDVVSYGIIMSAYVQQKSSQAYNRKALQLFDKLDVKRHNDKIIVHVLMACGNLKWLDKAMQIYKDYECKSTHLKDNIIVQNCLISLYSNCNEFDKAWNVYLSVKQTQRMDNITFVNILSACGVHKKVNEVAVVEEDLYQTYRDKCLIDGRIYNALLSGYTKCANVKESERVFQMIKTLGKEDGIACNLMLMLQFENNHTVSVSPMNNN
eukprot:961581_1